MMETPPASAQSGGVDVRESRERSCFDRGKQTRCASSEPETRSHPTYLYYFKENLLFRVNVTHAGKSHFLKARVTRTD